MGPGGADCYDRLVNAPKVHRRSWPAGWVARAGAHCGAGVSWREDRTQTAPLWWLNTHFCVCFYFSFFIFHPKPPYLAHKLSQLWRARRPQATPRCGRVAIFSFVFDANKKRRKNERVIFDRFAFLFFDFGRGQRGSEHRLSFYTSTKLNQDHLVCARAGSRPRFSLSHTTRVPAPPPIHVPLYPQPRPPLHPSHHARQATGDAARSPRVTENETEAKEFQNLVSLFFLHVLWRARTKRPQRRPTRRRQEGLG